jgi:cell division protease FtsH
MPAVVTPSKTQFESFATAAPPLASESNEYESSYSTFLKEVQLDIITHVDVAQDEKVLKATRRNGSTETVVLPIQVDIVDMLLSKHIDVTMKYIPGVGEFNMATGENVMKKIPNGWQSFMDWFVIALNVFVLGSILRFMMQGGGMPKMGGHFVSEQHPETPETTFQDVAGAEGAKDDLVEIVEFMKSPDKYAAVGAKVPKGVLLYGPPGTGKTLLARAVAGEAHVPFFSCSGSDFMELFVGMGASRVRMLFEKARKVSPSPCIIFIDEIDTIGKQRGGGNFGPGNDERDQTLNQLLTLMDGFNENTNIIVLAATNRIDILDDALLRPGRFDRRINVDLPDWKGRFDILKVHCRGKPLAEDVNLESFARITSGFSGADLMNLCNEAALCAARESDTSLTRCNFDDALEKITIGEERRSIVLSEKKRTLISYHEAGHVLVGFRVDDYDIVRKVSIVPRGSAGGITYFEPRDENIDVALVSFAYLRKRIMVALGGRIAEELVFGVDNITTGAAGDLMEVQEIAREMVTVYGFNENLGLANWSTHGSDEIINHDVKCIVDEAYAETLELVKANMSLLHVIANELMEKETLSYEELCEIIVYH